MPLAIFKQTVSQSKWTQKWVGVPILEWHKPCNDVRQTKWVQQTMDSPGVQDSKRQTHKYRDLHQWCFAVHSFMHTSFLFCHSSYCCHSKYCRNRVRRLQTKLCKFWAKRIAKHKNNHQSAVNCGLMKVAFCVWLDCLVIVVGRRHLQLLDK